MAERHYSMHDVEAVFGLTRTTLIYYEQLGIVQPARTGDANYRTFTDSDIFRLMSALVLKNAGIPLKEIAPYLDGDPMSYENLTGYLKVAQQQERYQHALCECLEDYVNCRLHLGEMEIKDVEAYYIESDNAEQGYKDFIGSTNLDQLILNIPLTHMGSIWETNDPFRSGSSGKWCRTVKVRHAYLIDGFVGEHSIGGCRCLVCRTSWSNIYEPLDDRDGWGQRIDQFLNENDLVISGNIFAPFCLPSEKRYIVPICIPVATKTRLDSSSHSYV